MIFKDAELDTSTHVDFVPMVDVLFNLLIFFLLATSMAQAEREMSVALPTAAAGGPISAALREIIVNVGAAGEITVGGKVIDDAALHTLVRDALNNNPGQKVSIRGDKATPYANVARVLGIVKSAGISEPYLETLPIEPSPR